MLRKPQFVRFLAGYGAAMAASSMIPIGITFAILDGGDSVAQAGRVLAVYALAAGLAVAAAGTVTGRIGRARTMLLGSLLSACSQLGAGVIMLRFPHPSWPLFMLAAVSGGGQGLASIAMAGAIRQVAGDSDLHTANAIAGLVGSVCAIAGPAVAGGAAAADPGWAIVAAGLCNLITATSAAGLAGCRDDAEGSVLAQFRAGWHAFWELRWLWPVSLYDAAGSLLVFAPFSILGADVARTSLGGAGAWGVILAGEGAGGVLGGILALTIRPSRPLAAAMAGRIAAVAPLTLLVIRAPLPLIVSAAAVAGVGFEVFAVLWGTTMQRLVPAASLTSVIATDWLVITVCAPIGDALIGPMVRGLGIDGTLWQAAIAVCALSVVVMSLPAIRAVQADP